MIEVDHALDHLDHNPVHTVHHPAGQDHDRDQSTDEIPNPDHIRDQYHLNVVNTVANMIAIVQIIGKVMDPVAAVLACIQIGDMLMKLLIKIESKT